MMSTEITAKAGPLAGTRHDADGRPALSVLLCAPRGFCAGVDRAIQIVELALERYGAPVYVRHEIVHNKYVVESLKRKGAVFVEELHEIPPTEQPVIFSAHGVPKSVPEAADRRNLFVLDATCPLVSKVHKEAEIQYRRGREVVLIGHTGHPEVVGTMGQLPPGTVSLVETVEDARRLVARDPDNLAWITQTTLSVDDTRDIVAVLQERFPTIAAPHKDDICYATTNRQEAVKAVAPAVDAMIVVGAPNSSNSQRLREVAERAGCPRAVLIQRASDIDWRDFAGISRLGIAAGASAPEVLVEEIIDAFANHFDVAVEEVRTAEETISFAVPRELRAVAAAKSAASSAAAPNAPAPAQNAAE
ncbi:4-hydroxy-3-methylbut-2-enyl diphosphate reductase [Pseudoxanthobacter soli DSM 19599]|uniref:4-hydroxy-3-methylbut-2-enyl diphosphate reductase n=2 Tax=Pseudoxanthobacter TaxID=433838 RepID=A0A1M7Z5E3_9HYPH|nr:4-hydroxy-3-methylbut-2-enyl diphosphate reductase [Pseudoxanthobacter soli DSM 19599]